VRAILKADGAYVLYLHPWEFDPGQPTVTAASPFFRFRHYLNLKQAAAKLRAFLGTFRDCRFRTCRDYVDGLSLARIATPTGMANQ
jgi:hypothetical protein